eukprot:CAMPEP_0114158640 /NCGR_PEP_ID=MMETSP0043_2-20121206/27336_1 /TAXON_ID=464988 /ORGANISM="Hemiselmis andersenii, Strain CCMP644" /LENGTH=227 /DNA_ID=CAMNT_0001254435 /DNA_START=203 /DNA_END=882 /DNA_ORIENTATION=+
MMRDTKLHLCARQRKANSKKALGELRVPAKGNSPQDIFNFMHGLLPKTASDPDGSKYLEKLLEMLADKFKSRQTYDLSSVPGVTFDAPEAPEVEKATAQSFVKIPVDITSNAHNRLKVTEEKQLAECLSNLGLSRVSVAIKGEQGTKEPEDKSEKDKDFESTLGVAGPLNDEQLDKLRKTVQNCKMKILEMVDAEVVIEDVKPTLSEKIHVFIPYIVAIFVAILLIV